jgi:hypothetical protein
MTMHAAMPSRVIAAVMVALIGLSVILQVVRDRGWQPYEPATPLLWLQSASTVKRASLGFDALVADIYWMRAVVYFGRQSISDDPDKNYDLLYPFLDFVTSLDPRFSVAYRFGAIFLSEAVPVGPGRPDLAIALLEKGVRQQPHRWEYLHDIGFVHYWHNRDFDRGAQWLERAAEIPGAPIWLRSTAAMMHTQSGNRQSARQLWIQIREGSDAEAMRNIADVRLAQFDTLDLIDQLNAILVKYQERTGQPARSWREVVAAGLLRAAPADPTGVPIEIDAADGRARLSKQSPLAPLPEGFAPTPR